VVLEKNGGDCFDKCRRITKSKGGQKCCTKKLKKESQFYWSNRAWELPIKRIIEGKIQGRI
jgi:hypothetical protein